MIYDFLEPINPEEPCYVTCEPNVTRLS